MIFSGDECLYVGQSKHLQRRWKIHHRMRQLTQISDDLVMAWVIASPQALQHLETLLIRQLQPRMNGSPQPSGQTFVRLPDELIAELDRYVEILAEEQPGLKPSRSDAIRILLYRGLEAEKNRRGGRHGRGEQYPQGNETS